MDCLAASSVGAFWALVTDYGECRNLSFSEFVLGPKLKQAAASNRHFRLQTDYCQVGALNITYDAILRYDKLAEGGASC